MHLGHCMLNELNQGKNATQAANAICSVYGNDAVSVQTYQYWFARFRLEDKKGSGRPPELITDELETLVEEDPRQSSRELANKLND